MCRFWLNDDPSEENIEEEKVDNLEILTDNDFSEKYNSQRQSKFWKKLRYVQTCVKSKTGVGIPIII